MESQPPVWPPLLDWSDRRHWGDFPAPCVLCKAPTRLMSDRGKACHKVCAEEWFEKHPEAWAAYQTNQAQQQKTPQL